MSVVPGKDRQTAWEGVRMGVVLHEFDSKYFCRAIEQANGDYFAVLNFLLD